jgi:hypothetical protein
MRVALTDREAGKERRSRLRPVHSCLYRHCHLSPHQDPSSLTS